MGLRGPMPTGVPPLPPTEPAKPPPTPNDWHPRARRWFNSLKNGPQRNWMLDSDWSVALIGGDALSRWMKDPAAPVALLSAWTRVSEQLMATHRTRVAGGIDDVQQPELFAVPNQPTDDELRARIFPDG